MITEAEFEKLEIGQEICYSGYVNIFFGGEDLTTVKRHVIMTDKNGNTKSVYLNLFLRYATIVK